MDAMPPTHQRRSCRIAAFIPIRVYGFDHHGVDFVEEASTMVVNLHGAKIRLLHQLIPQAEICLYSHPTCQEGVFRVISRVPESHPQCSFWGIEATNPRRNIWGLNIPALEPIDQATVRVYLQCPECSTRELVRINEPLLISARQQGGIERCCLVCGKLGRWKVMAYEGN